MSILLHIIGIWFLVSKMKRMTEEQALRYLRRIGFEITKLSPKAKYVECLGGEVLQHSGKDLIELAESYKEDRR